MQYFIGIVPSDQYMKKIIHFQRKWSHNTLPDIVEPHITLKAQGGLTPNEKWIEQVKEICKDFQPFQIKLEKPMFFGEDILYLSASSKKLFKLHEKIVESISPTEDLIKRYFELDDYVPHLTLAKTYYGLSKKELNDLAELANQELKPYPTFDVNFIRVYKETVDKKGYEKYVDIPLGR